MSQKFWTEHTIVLSAKTGHLGPSSNTFTGQGRHRDVGGGRGERAARLRLRRRRRRRVGQGRSLRRLRQGKQRPPHAPEIGVF